MIGEWTVSLSWVPWAVALAVSLLLSAAYSGLETGVYVLNKIRLDLRAESGSHPARVLRALLRHPDRVVTTVLIGTNIGNYLLTFSISALFLEAGRSEGAEWYTLAVATPVLFIFAESLPKNLFQRFPEPLVYRLAWLLRGTAWVLTACGVVPAVYAFARLFSRSRGARQGLAHEGLPAVLAESQASGALTHAQAVMADRIMRLPSLHVAEVMKPLAQVIAAGPDATREELIGLTQFHNLSRLPILGEGMEFIGILDIHDVLTAPPGAAPMAMMTPPLLLDARSTLTDALYHMQKSRAAMAVVTGPGGKHVGIVTIKDLVEEIVGELQVW